MKKILFAIAIVLTFGLTANAQSDGFFKNWDNGMGDRTGSAISDITPVIPGGTPGEYENDQEAPLGSGLLVLTALGAGYAVARNKKNRE